MHRVLRLAFLGLAAGSVLLPARAAAGVSPWSVRAAETFIRRHPDSIAYAGDRRGARWNYEQGVMLEAVRQVWVATGDDRYVDYIRRIVDRMVMADGRIPTYEYTTYNLDNIPTGRQLLLLSRRFPDPRYRIAADTLRRQLRDHPRTREGGFWHKLIYPYQMWLDGLYMAGPFYAAYALQTGEDSAFDDIANQFVFMERHARDSSTGLLYHGWDESRQQRWADPATGRSPHFWGRAMGWYAMGLVDALDVFPERHPRRAALLAILRRLADALRAHRDSESGLWYQVVDQGARAGNYLEASASCMYIYLFAKGARLGFLDSSYFELARRSFAAVVERMVTVDSLGNVDLHQTCQVAGLGGSPYRDGSYAYYVSEPRRTNDFKGLGPFIMAAVELERGAPSPVRWQECLRQPASWYRGPEAARIAENVLLYQRSNGGWPKNIDMAAVLASAERRELAGQKDAPGSTIDNGATTTQMRYLARVRAATGTARYADAFLMGLEYLLRAQYAGGGWPQFYPLVRGYPSHITFNDDAMANVLNLLLDVSAGKGEFSFVGETLRGRAAAAVERGIACILACQIRVNGELTAWCAQHDERTLAPARARSYELASLSGNETVGIVRVLMRLEHPSPAVVAAVQAAVRWLDRSRLTGMRLVADSTGPYDIDRIVTPDSVAPPVWARFYEIGTNRPFFCDRDGVPRQSLEEISWERRNNYGWLGTWPAELLATEYPAWQRRWAPRHNVLAEPHR